MRRLSIALTTFSIAVLFNSVTSRAETAKRDYGIIKNQDSPYAKLKSVDLKDVHWTDGFWAGRFAQTCDVTLPRLWELASDPDKGHAIKNLRIAASLAVPRMNGKNPVHGINLMRHILSKSKEPIPERTVFWELTGKVAARKGKWKLVGKIESQRGQWNQTAAELKYADLELYNLEEDVGESKGIRKKNPKEYLELKKKLITFFENIK